ncbi:hypothetical protein ACFFIX_19225 [Metabacillus herbersteinensis]|uniref:Uncharacterized protein n=1 Tax=Metabacillus herbersteinensis TaxID=283816 RepID=A0ABV6GIL3_9BACI
MEQKEFPVAHLNEHQLQTLQQIEDSLRAETGEEIVLIAYEHKDN